MLPPPTLNRIKTDRTRRMRKLNPLVGGLERQQNKRCKDKKKSILYKQMQQHEKVSENRRDSDEPVP